LGVVDSCEYQQAWIEAEMRALIVRFGAGDPWAWALEQSGDLFTEAGDRLSEELPLGNDDSHSGRYRPAAPGQ